LLILLPIPLIQSQSTRTIWMILKLSLVRMQWWYYLH